MRLSLLAAVVLLSSCVTQGTYDALQAEHDKTLGELKARDQKVQDLEAALKSEQERSRRLGEKIGELEQAWGKTQSDKSALESALADLKKRKEESEARVAEFRALLDKFKSLIDSGKLRVKIKDGWMVVELATDILFPSGSATLSKEGKAAITEVAELLKTMSDRKFQVQGHTDNVPGKGRSNWELAAARALTVLNTMVAAGVPENHVSAASFGESAPAKPNDTPENRAANRRIEIVVVPDLSSLPGFDELQRVSQ